MRCGELVKALEMMKTHVQTTTPDATLAQAVDLMDLYQTPSLPVINEAKKLIGVISERDIVRASAEHGTEKAKDLPVAAYISKNYVAVNEHELVTSLLKTMYESRWERMPVVTEDYQVVGMLNCVDVLQALFEGSISDEFPDPV